MSVLLKLDHVAAAYGQSQVLWDIDLDIEDGGAVALIGRNGVGKTTLFKTIIGALRLTSGSIWFKGEDISKLQSYERARKGIGLVPQGRHIFPHLTVEENLETGLSALAGRGQAIGAIPDHIYDLFPKLNQIKARKAGVLSGGEQQQLAIGRALCGRPSLLLLDEPTEGIQPNVVQQIEDALRRIRRELKVTIVIIEQYLDFAWSFADHYSVMQRGHLIRQGSTRDETAADVAHLVNI
ncbi:High-affinity branched-chain amino acid transport ATP-binding protein LivF [Methylocella tundrae]|jgi:urea transport system ATP-binding protein|uniref:High-affinity branched-chain amino acid transport ATP-binding protein LivF n=1 Tax=Methylocella tundrae TaxID=227605 RepID=A0A4U8Z307_METTU|nr:urea ABC transporter ATP-binding subunit UrtE [Methylocella tundrae]WPP03623.1 urea ABC transporter ATP-binding subunit UrtE [Methylocella tundrae]VFU09747.1 High-affinity branched-chain amino acid transport ATP-binding protein LivF [Methylocella tundrae]VTZ27618.1 High-affinity branched-chain amino acid transport ATP-binding protein LivF [Methylocella tundrae]VTZ49442.1 High-affinity branched-chain amino acid transport ATP-binding protein LivF [Methylocella tundrae]